MKKFIDVMVGFSLVSLLLMLCVAMVGLYMAAPLWLFIWMCIILASIALMVVYER